MGWLRARWSRITGRRPAHVLLRSARKKKSPSVRPQREKISALGLGDLDLRPVDLPVLALGDLDCLTEVVELGSVLFRQLRDVAGGAVGLRILGLVLLLDVHGGEGCAAQGDRGESGDDGGDGFLHGFLLPYSGPTVPRSIEVPWRGSADRVGLQLDG